MFQAFGEKYVTERGCDGQRDGEGGEDGENVTDGERRKETALQAGEREDGQEYERDDESCEDDGAADFERSVENDVERRPRSCERFIFAQAAQNIFDVDDGVIDDFADGDGEAAERDGV